MKKRSFFATVGAALLGLGLPKATPEVPAGKPIKLTALHRKDSLNDRQIASLLKKARAKATAEMVRLADESIWGARRRAPELKGFEAWRKTHVIIKGKGNDIAAANPSQEPGEES